MKKKEINGAKFGIPKPKRKTGYGEHEDIANPDGPLSLYKGGPLGITDMSPGSILPVPGDMGDSIAIAKIWDMPFGSASDTIADSSEQYSKVIEALEKMSQEMEKKGQEPKEEEEEKEEKPQSPEKQPEEQEVWTRYINAHRRIQALGMVCGAMNIGSTLTEPLDVYVPVVGSKVIKATVEATGESITGVVSPEIQTLRVNMETAKDFRNLNLTSGIFALPIFYTEEQCDAFIVIAEKMIEEFISAVIETQKVMLENLEKPFKVII